MRDAFRVVRWTIGLTPLLLVGCAGNPLVMQQQMTQLHQQQAQLALREREGQQRAQGLDRDNQELETLLAQRNQENQLLQDQLGALREQLGSVSTQIGQLREEKQAVETKAQTMVASRRSGATITANNSLRGSLPAINLPGVEVREDRDVIRVEIPAARVFQPGTARLASDAPQLLDTLAGELARAYPNQVIGVEGHTDSDPALGQAWLNLHQLSLGQSMAVYDYLVARSRLRPSQLFVAGFGANHPLVSNATGAGRERNRRVELVVYPESVTSP